MTPQLNMHVVIRILNHVFDTLLQLLKLPKNYEQVFPQSTSTVIRYGYHCGYEHKIVDTTLTDVEDIWCIRVYSALSPDHFYQCCITQYEMDSILIF